MTISITFTMNDIRELKSAIGEVEAAFAEVKAVFPRAPKVVALVEAPEAPEPAPEGGAEPPALTNRQRAAANARAAKAAKDAKDAKDALEDPAVALGPPDGANGANGAAAPEDDDLGLVDPSMSPAEAKDAGLALVRECYAAGKVAEVKALQKEWAVAKFYDVPMEKGHEFFSRVMKMAVETGIRK